MTELLLQEQEEKELYALFSLFNSAQGRISMLTNNLLIVQEELDSVLQQRKPCRYAKNLNKLYALRFNLSTDFQQTQTMRKNAEAQLKEFIKTLQKTHERFTMKEIEQEITDKMIEMAKEQKREINNDKE